MKHCLLKNLLTAMLLLCGITAFAETVVIGGITYDIVVKAKTAKVITSAEKYYGDIVIPDTIVYNDAKYAVTAIGNSAFYECKNVTSVKIPGTVTTIDTKAFYYCLGLTSVTMAEGVTNIEDYAFKDCKKLTSIRIPKSVTFIGYCTFSGCTSLKDIHISDIEAWCRIDFDGGGSNPFYQSAENLYLNGELVTKLEFPKSCSEIKGYTFDCYEKLEEVIIPNSITKIGKYAFRGCTGLTDIEISNSVTTIASHSFESCSNITSVTIGNGVTKIENDAFRKCTKLTSITIPNSVTKIDGNSFEACSALATVVIGTGVKEIYTNAFGSCESLTDVYCLATTPPKSTYTDAFANSYPEYITLHVPEESMSTYRTTEPWNTFGNIVALNNEVGNTPICATPVISYSNGKLTIECETEGSEFITEITSSDIDKFYKNSIELSGAYNISVYAIADGHENSETVNATLCWIENGDSENGAIGIINIPATAALITSNNGTITVNCSLNGEAVAVYTTGGVLVGTTTIENGSATIATGLSKGAIAIIKIGEKSVKVII